MTMTLRKAAGSLLVVGLGSTELTTLERAWLKLIRPAGIILFKRNIADPLQTRAVLNESTALCATANLRCVDVEGGTVDRLRDALAPMPSAQSVARAAEFTANPDLAREHAGEPNSPRRQSLRLKYDPGPRSRSRAAGFCRSHGHPRCRSRIIRCRRIRVQLSRRSWPLPAGHRWLR